MAAGGGCVSPHLFRGDWQGAGAAAAAAGRETAARPRSLKGQRSNGGGRPASNSWEPLRRSCRGGGRRPRAPGGKGQIWAERRRRLRGRGVCGGWASPSGRVAARLPGPQAPLSGRRSALEPRQRTPTGGAGQPHSPSPPHGPAAIFPLRARPPRPPHHLRKGGGAPRRRVSRQGPPSLPASPPPQDSEGPRSFPRLLAAQRRGCCCARLAPPLFGDTRGGTSHPQASVVIILLRRLDGEEGVEEAAEASEVT